MHDAGNSASWEIDSEVWDTLRSSRELQYAGEGGGKGIFHLAQILFSSDARTPLLIISECLIQQQHFLWFLLYALL